MIEASSLLANLFGKPFLFYNEVKNKGNIDIDNEEVEETNKNDQSLFPFGKPFLFYNENMRTTRCSRKPNFLESFCHSIPVSCEARK